MSVPFFVRYATKENRWYALIFLALGLGAVIIDNTILNVSIPYILRDLATDFSKVEWAISGYAMTISALLITAGRIGEIIGYRKMYSIGIVIFMLGSLIASEALGAGFLIFGRAVVQAIGAAIILTSALALLATNFQGRDRAVAFGVWGSIAGASATIGPIIGGYLTTYHSWRWSLRINIIIGIIVLLGTIFIRESEKNEKSRFDILGALLSGVGLFAFIFSVIEGQRYGWITPVQSVSWWSFSFSFIPVLFFFSLILLTIFAFYESMLLRRKGTPLFQMTLFQNKTFSIGLALLGTLTMGMLGMIFVLPILLENVFHLNAIQTGMVLMPMSLFVFLLGLSSAFLTARFRLKHIIVFGVATLVLGTLGLIATTLGNITLFSFLPALVLFGIGFGLASAQLNNIIMSAVPQYLAGEASAMSVTLREIGTAVGIAFIGAIFSGVIDVEIARTIQNDSALADNAKPAIIETMKNIDIESGTIDMSAVPSADVDTLQADIDVAITVAARRAFEVSFMCVLIAIFLALSLPKNSGKDS